MMRARFEAIAALCGLALAFLSHTALAAAPAPADLVDPFVGAEGGGNTTPGAQVPFGFVSLGPDTSRGHTSGWDARGLVLGFSHTHVSGTGGASKYGNFRVTPAIGDDAFGNLAFPRVEERASPGFYSVVIGREGKRIRAELAASRLVGVERFTFPATDRAEVVLDAAAAVPLGGNGQRVKAARVEVIDARHISGQASVRGGWGSGGYTLYFYGEFDRPAAEVGRWRAHPGRVERIEGPGPSEGGDQSASLAERVGTFATFDARSNPAVQLRLAVSFVSMDQARRNLESDPAGADFDTVRASARRAWDEALGKITVEGGTDAERRIFYSALYRAHTMPHDLTGENAWWSSDEPHYEDFYTLWDTFRTVNPLMTLIEPERERGMARSLIDTYAHTGWLPDARIAGSTGPTQGGSNGDIVLADAIVKDLGGFDTGLAWQAMLKDADVQSPDPLNYGRELGDYLKLGYMSLDQTRSASRTLEYAAEDFAIAGAAAKLGHMADAERLRKRSGAWANLWDPALGCIHPRYADGRRLENFDCDRDYPDETTAWWDPPFYEGTSRQYSTYVPQDVDGLMRRLGGPAAFTAWLDKLFDGGGYTQDNEPDILAPFLYIHAGRPDLAQRRVRAIMAHDYKPSLNGLPGNDDAGTLSAWYVWAAMGLFPNAGQPWYYIASPAFTRSTIDLGAGRRFVVEAPEASDANLYVQSATLNDRPLDRAWLTHREIAAGGRLVLHMGPTPSAWAAHGPAPGTRID